MRLFSKFPKTVNFQSPPIQFSKDLQKATEEKSRQITKVRKWISWSVAAKESFAIVLRKNATRILCFRCVCVYVLVSTTLYSTTTFKDDFGQQGATKVHHTYDHHKERRAKNAITLDNKEKFLLFSLLKRQGKIQTVVELSLDDV